MSREDERISAEGTALDALLRNVSNGVIIVNTQGLITHINPAAARTLEATPQELMSQPLTSLIHKGNGQGAAEDLSAYLGNPAQMPPGAFVKGRFYLGQRLLQVRLRPVYDEAGNWGGWVLMFQDERRFEFIYNVLMEARTSVTALRGFSELLLRGAAGPTNEAQDECLRTIRDNLESQSVLIEDVYSIAHIDSEHNRMRITQVDLKALLQSTLGEIQGRAHFQKKGLHVAFSVADADLSIEADEEKLRHLMSRVIENAFNYTEPGGAVSIHAGPQPDQAGRVLITVADTGVGIPDDYKERIWRRFERHDDTTLALQVPGTGLGLAIALALVQMHQGEIWFDSQIKAGTTFYIVLPRQQTLTL